jgi:hypothetical protein
MMGEGEKGKEGMRGRGQSLLLLSRRERKEERGLQ